MHFISAKYMDTPKYEPVSIYATAFNLLFPGLDTLSAISSAISTIADRLVDTVKRKVMALQVKNLSPMMSLDFEDAESLHDTVAHLSIIQESFSEAALEAANPDDIRDAIGAAKRIEGLLSDELDRRHTDK